MNKNFLRRRVSLRTQLIFYFDDRPEEYITFEKLYKYYSDLDKKIHCGIHMENKFYLVLQDLYDEGFLFIYRNRWHPRERYFSKLNHCRKRKEIVCSNTNWKPKPF